MQDFEDFVMESPDRTIGGANYVDYDKPILERMFQDLRMRWPFGRRHFDLHGTFYDWCEQHGVEVPVIEQPEDGTFKAGVRSSNARTDHIFGYCNLPPREKAHGALDNCEYTAEARHRLLHGKNFLPRFAEYELPKELTD
ncbi:MAG: hypothetical protein ACE5FT_01940 [Candidatus Nanoarchaeia archaeon]